MKKTLKKTEILSIINIFTFFHNVCTLPNAYRTVCIRFDLLLVYSLPLKPFVKLKEFADDNLKCNENGKKFF